MNIVSTKMTNFIATNVTSTALINRHSKKVTDCYILNTVLFSDHIIINSYYYLLLLCKTKGYNIKWKIKTCYYFSGIIKLEDFYFDN